MTKIESRDDRARHFADMAEYCNIDRFRAYTIADDAIDLEGEDDTERYPDPNEQFLLRNAQLLYTSDDDFDDFRHELRHELDLMTPEADPSGLDLCDTCRECAMCCDC